jgi:acyl-CoA reductase-like NAD-dependent aldehyde dehydrogenase
VPADKQLINGRWEDAAGAGSLDLVNPATGFVIDSVPFGDETLGYKMAGINDWYPVTAEARFGGMEQSGIGRESGSEGILECMETTTRYFEGL